MHGRGSKCTTSPEPSGPHDDSFSYSLTPKGKAALAEFGRAAERHERRRELERSAKANGRRCGTVCGRWRDKKHVPEVRLSGHWLQAAGFELGQVLEVGVEEDRLVIQAV